MKVTWYIPLIIAVPMACLINVPGDGLVQAMANLLVSYVFAYGLLGLTSLCNYAVRKVIRNNKE